MLRINTQTLFCLSLLTNLSFMHAMETENGIWNTLVKGIRTKLFAYTEEAKKKEEGVWKNILKEIRIKVFAYADWETKIKMYRCWPDVFQFTMNDLLQEHLQESPIMVSRKCFLFHLIDMARHENKEGFSKLLNSAAHCDSDTVLYNIEYFLSPKSDEKMMLEKYIDQQDNDAFKQVLPYILEVFKGGQKVWGQFMINSSEGIEFGGDAKYKTPLNKAIYKVFPSGIIELLALQNPEWINSKQTLLCCNEKTPLCMAVENEDAVTCKFLLSFAHIKINELSEGFQPKTVVGWCGTESFEARSKINMTPLMYAVSKGNLEIVQMLVKHGADINCQNSEGHTALYFALQQKQQNNGRPANFRLPNINKMVNFLLRQPNLIYGPHDEAFLDQLSGS